MNRVHTSYGYRIEKGFRPERGKEECTAESLRYPVKCTVGIAAICNSEPTGISGEGKK